MDLENSGDGAGDKKDQKIKVHGTISGEGTGSTENRMAGPNILGVANKVEISALGNDGKLTPVTTADVKADGTFDANVAQNESPTGVFIMSVKDVADSVVGSAVLNGIPAFAYGFLVDAPIDTLTSFKTEVLMTMARGGTPGIQNYLNVVNTLLDAELAGIIVTGGAFVQDFTTILSTTSDAVIAAVNVLESALNSVGLPINLDALTDTQSAIVSGIVKTTNKTNSKLTSDAKALLASLQAATAKGAAPLDEAIFNAVVSGGAMFDSKMKGGMPANMNADVNLALAKQLFKVESEMSSAMSEDGFAKMGMGSDVIDTLGKATETLLAQITGAKSIADLDAAKAQFKGAFLGQNEPRKSILELVASAVGLGPLLQEVQDLIAPVAKNLTDVLKAPFDALNVGNALAKFDADTKTVPNSLMKNMGEGEAKVVASALTRIEKVIAR